MNPVFTAQELKRVGTAATMLVVCGTIVIIGMTMMLGHYNSLAHAGPKAAIDGVVIGLLMGRQARWRCLSLLGIVYGLVLLLQVGVFYLLPVTILAAVIAAGMGRCIEPVHRPIAVMVAAISYELLAGFGAPIKIYFGTGGRSEPFVWGLWFAEWPLRIAGAAIGVWMAGRFKHPEPAEPIAIPMTRSRSSRQVGTVPPAVALVMSLIACVAPLLIESIPILSAICLAFVAYAIWAGLRRGLLHAALALLWGWAVFGILSYAWNRDLALVQDLGRTLVLRFAPLTLASMVLVAAVRPLDMLRFLNRIRTPRAVLLPLASVLRSIPHARHSMRHSIQTLRHQGHWNGPLSVLRRPITIFRALLTPQLTRWAGQLSEQPANRSASTTGEHVA